MSTKLTPMMDQYRAVKQENPDCLLFFRLGDFYEMFFEDAETASKELGLTLTSRASGESERAPMCGIPYHASEPYIQRLVQKGYKVAICEQMEDPKLAKGLVKRAITRIVTPGTSMDENQPGGTNNYILCINRVEDSIGLAASDISTGEFLVTEFAEEEKLSDEITKFQPSEIVVNQELIDMQSLNLSSLADRYHIYINAYPAFHFQYERCREEVQRQFGVISLEGLGMDSMDMGVTAAGALLEYLTDTQKRELTHIRQLRTYSVQDYMLLDSSTRRNLELTETLRDKNYKGSLLWVLDHTQTAMGGRRLRKWLEQPLIRKESIEERLDCVQNFVDDPMLCAEFREVLSGIYDMERLIGRVSYGSANARDLIAMRDSLKALPSLKTMMQDLTAPGWRHLEQKLDTLEDISTLLEDCIADDPPIMLHEGGLIKPGYNEQVDTYRSAASNGKQWLADLEAREKQATGIKNLRVGYNHVFGYYLEVSKGQVPLVPDRYIRRQTLVTGERYITEELKKIEDTLVGAKDKGDALEYDLFCQARDKVYEAMDRIQQSADVIADLDAIRSLAETAYRNHYVKPEILPPGGEIEIIKGRHPVVEQMLPENSFIPNDTHMGGAPESPDRIAIITGPNMAGKSTYMRQVAAITLLAQIGSYVPAQSARISITDRIFTRVGASDDLARGQSTFMVEMSEVSNILRHATRNSLLILDEIGRGTSTFDGLSIAWAVVEYISDPDRIGAKTLFATHYHELTQLEGQLPGVKNYCVNIKESESGVIFLHTIRPGKGDQSYGIEVARLAGLPDTVLDRAHEILSELLGRDIVKKAARIKARNHLASAPEETRVQDTVPGDQVGQLKLENSGSAAKPSLTEAQQKVLEEIKSLDVDRVSPLEAVEKLYALKALLEKQ